MTTPSPSDEQPRKTGRLLILAAAVLWSSSGLFAKLTIFDDWPPVERGLLFGFWRAFFAGLVLVPLVRQPVWRPAIAGMVASFAGMNATYMAALALTTAGNAIWLQNLAPLWVFLIGWLVLRQPFERQNLVGLVLGVAGVAVIVGFEFGRGDQIPGVVCGLISGLGYATVVVFLRQLRDVNTNWLVVLNHFGAATVLLPIVVWLRLWPSPTQLAVLAAFGSLQLGVPYLLFAKGVRSVSSQEAAMIVLIEPMLTPIWAYAAAGEVPAAWTIAGGALILLGLVLRYTLHR